LLDIEVGEAVRLQLQLIQIDVKHGSVRKIVGGNGCESGKLPTLGDHLLGGLLNLRSIGARDGKGVLPLVIFRRTGADLQNRVRSEQKGSHTM